MRQKAIEPITIARSYFPDEDIQVFLHEAPKILQGRVSMGTWFERFQEAAARAQGTRFACATNSCTSALEVALLACGVRPGDKVAVPAQTFIATGMAVHNIGAVPLFCDIRQETLCMDPADLERRCEKAKAVIVVHFGGLISSDIVRIRQICKQLTLALIEDAAHAHGARYDGKAAGAFGEAACFSFYPTKILTCGEGGMIVTNSGAVEAVCRSYQFRGQDFSLPGEQFALPYGSNIRVPELSALLGVLQYKRLDEFIAQRRAVAAVYNDLLAHEATIFIPPAPPACFHSYWLYPIVLPAQADRETLQKECLELWNINIRWSYFPPLHLMPVFKNLYGCRPGMLPVAEDVQARIVCLPVHPRMSVDDARYVAECFLEVYRHHLQGGPGRP
jgi:dTDP-4-amino-4,6-dideoxygalactose transaminase